MPLINWTGGSSGGGFNINGIIEQYKVAAGESVSSGDFVEFIIGSSINTSSEINIEDTTQISSNSVSTAGINQAVLLSENKIFIVHSDSLNRLYGLIVMIEGNNILPGISTLISSATGSSVSIGKAVLVDENTIFISSSGSSPYCLFGIIITISGDTINVGATTQLSSLTRSGSRAIQVEILDTNKIFISYGAGDSVDNTFPYGQICTIQSGVISAGTETQISSLSRSGYYGIQTKMIDVNTLWILYVALKSRRFYCNFINVQNGIDVGTESQISSTNIYGTFSNLEELEGNKYFMVYQHTSTMRGMILYENNQNVSVLLDAQISSLTRTSSAPSQIESLGSDIMLLIFGGGSSASSTSVLYGKLVKIHNNAVENGEEVILSDLSYSGGAANKTILLGGNKYFTSFIGGSSTAYCYGAILDIIGSIDIQIKKYNSIINGVSKTNGISGDEIDVYVPNN